MIAIDGACRRNGKPDCVSAGGVFIRDLSTGECSIFTLPEVNSTNQRGEMFALIGALNHIKNTGVDAQIVTDSEYLFNAMTKCWPHRWDATGWRTSAGEPVKNADLWKTVLSIYKTITSEVMFYHIKGHVIPFGKVTAQNLLFSDPSGDTLYRAAIEKFRTSAKEANIAHAQDLSERNNGFQLDREVLERFVASNVVVDAVATGAVEEADRNI
jgi:ribonuclease HI